MKTVTLQLKGMHCTSCAWDIDGNLEDMDGIKEAKTNYAKQQTEVMFDPKKVTLEKMIAVIKGIDNDYAIEVID